MITDFVSITQLQRHPRDAFISNKPFQIVLSNNELLGLVISSEAAKSLLESDIFQQLREELWELHDDETAQCVKASRKGKGKFTVSFNQWQKKHGL